MEKGDFGKIRDLARALKFDPNNPGEDNIGKRKKAFALMRQMKERDRARFLTYVDNFSSTKRLNDRVPAQLRELFLKVAREKDQEYMDGHQSDFGESAFLYSHGDQKQAETVLTATIDRLGWVSDAIRKDSRMQNVPEETLNLLIEHRKKVIGQYVQKLTGQSRSKSKLH